MIAEQVIDKVRKLLAIAESTPFEAEAQTAMALAQKLLLEHELSMTDVSDSDPDRKFEEAIVFKGTRAPPVGKYVAAIVNEFFFCYPIVDRRSDGLTRAVLFGRREHVAVGVYVFGFLTRIFLALWPPYKRHRRLPQRERQTFWMGMQLGLDRRLRREREQLQRDSPAGFTAAANQLIKIDRDLVVAAREHFGNIGKARGAGEFEGDWQTLRDGAVRGETIDIRKPLPAPERRLAITEER
jgi:hypothetical protein